MKSGAYVVCMLILWSTDVVAGADAGDTASKSVPEPGKDRAELVGHEARPRGPFMAWRGQDAEMRFVRAELWIGAEAGPVELFVWSSSGEQARTSGFLVTMPPAAKSLEFAQLFIVGEPLFGYGPVAATILRDGTLRLYPTHVLFVSRTLELKPVTGRGLE